MRQAIENVGTKAAVSGKPMAFPNASQVAVDWLVERVFAAKTSQNKIVLMSTCLESTTTVSQPMLVELPDSVFGLRKKLRLFGWRPSSRACPPSVSDKFFRGQSSVKAYFQVLLQRF